MSKEFAGRHELQSGQRFLDGSVPRLRRHAVSCESAAGEIFSPTAGKDKKPSRELEGSALVGREAPLSSSLVYLSNNRNTLIDSLLQRPIGRGKWCGHFTIRGRDPQTGKTQYRRVNCGCWTCSYCGPRLAKLAKWAIRRWAEELQLSRFLTLTLDPSKLSEVQYDIRYLRWVFNKFRVYLSRRYGEAPKYIAVVELHRSGVPHLHILIDRYIEQAWISNVWDRLGGGRIVHIKRVGLYNAARYVSKYLTKQMLLSAPKGTRRITTARSVRLFEKRQPTIAWELLKQSIWVFLEIYQHSAPDKQLGLFQVIDIEKDEHGFLRAFAVFAQNAN